jgi:transposase
LAAGEDKKMGQYISGTDRRQIFLFNECLDEMIDPNSIVRFIDAYVESIDMESLGFNMHTEPTGTPAYRPQLKLKIYVYGYFEKIRTSRKLEKECLRNKEMIWLTEGLAPDFKTIADFRKDNYESFRNIFKEFLKICHKLDLISFETVAIDGSKLRSGNSLNEIYKREGIEKIEKEITERIDNYLKELEEMDRKEAESGIAVNEEKVGQITERLNKEMKRQDKVKLIAELFKNDPELKTYFATDHDCRLQSDKGKIRPGYNVQTVVDDKAKLIVVSDVTNEQNDKNYLAPMLLQVEETKAELGVEGKTKGVADCGYFSEKNIIESKKIENVEMIVSVQAEGKKDVSEGDDDSSKELKPQENFAYDKDKDLFICPQGKELKKVNKTPVIDSHGRETDRYRCAAEICAACAEKMNCTKSDNGRMLRVSKNREIMTEYINGLSKNENKRLIDKRKEIVEHPFGTIKKNLGYTDFVLRGIKKVKAEFGFICFIYNLKRVLNLIRMDKLLISLKA